MTRTIALLLIAIAIPIISYFADAPLAALQATTLHKLLIIYVTTALACYAVAELTRNCSQVDKLWSVMPVVYAWVMADAAGFTPRALLMAFLVTAWGVRLTYNFGRRGGYSWKFWEGEEDYRWEVLRRNPVLAKPWAWRFFNLFFISLYQMGLVLLFTLPMLLVMSLRPAKWASWMWRSPPSSSCSWSSRRSPINNNGIFRRKSTAAWHRGSRSPAAMPGGFVRDGLWGMARHPNYAAEQAQWIVFYFSSVASTGRWVNWSLCGAILLVLLFQGSSDFSEGISTEKYPGYGRHKGACRVSSRASGGADRRYFAPDRTAAPRMRTSIFRPEYDVIVIGAGISGLTAAGLLSRAGLSVCVLEMDARPGGYLAGFRRKDFRFDSAIHWLNQLGPDGLVTRVFSM